MADAATQAQLQKLSETFQSLQAELQTTVDGRQKLESQMQENSMVLTELNLVGDGRSVYNKIGPVLLKQDKAEAVMAVKSRIDYITGEIKRVEEQISGIQKKIEGTRTEIIQVQTAAQSGAA